MDLIDRQAAIAIIQSMYPGIPRVPWMRKDWQERYAPYIRTENAIRELPSAEKTGRWLSTWHKDEVVCSNCRKYWVLATDVYDYKYCPNCGARMEG